MASTNFGVSGILGWGRVGDRREWYQLAIVIDRHRKDHRPQRFGELWDVKGPCTTDHSPHCSACFPMGLISALDRTKETSGIFTPLMGNHSHGLTSAYYSISGTPDSSRCRTLSREQARWRLGRTERGSPNCDCASCEFVVIVQ